MRLRYLFPVLLVGLLAWWSGGARAAGGEAACVGGSAAGYPCDDVSLLAHVPLAALGAEAGVEAANVWGWTDEASGREFVLLGLTDGTAFVEVTEPTAPLYLGTLPTHTTPSTYRDVKTMGHYALIIADAPSEHGMQIFDLTELLTVAVPPVTFVASTHFDGFGNGHNLFVNEETGFAYVARTTGPLLCDGALGIVDVSDPLSPTWAGCYSDGGLASDAMCVVYHGPDAAWHGHELCAVASDDNILLADVTNKAAPQTLATRAYMHVARAHNAWFTEDHRFFVSSDMNDEHHHGMNTRIFLWDVSDVENPVLADVYTAPDAASDHNVWVKDGLVYVGNFRAGLRILQLHTMGAPALHEVAYFDLVPEDNAAGHEGGVWAAYPFFPSGTLATSDRQEGLFLLRHEPSAPTALTLTELTGRSAPAVAPVAALLLAGLTVAAWHWKRRR